MKVHLTYHRKKKDEVLQKQSSSPLHLWNQMRTLWEDKQISIKVDYAHFIFPNLTTVTRVNLKLYVKHD